MAGQPRAREACAAPAPSFVLTPDEVRAVLDRVDGVPQDLQEGAGWVEPPHALARKSRVQIHWSAYPLWTCYAVLYS